ncbi:hypothetical protein PEPS_45890 (plasmid) [Persicobacter psychrovividus]|uniref:Uncharacterized protein n=1 Tax=Persicobacter psychrovividus TaxID=387638 RepID=A0ABN6LL49_9BACT|nr:hypothetical protein PEPS_45890 [Persicobacter psychrovividus]
MGDVHDLLWCFEWYYMPRTWFTTNFEISRGYLVSTRNAF